MTEVFPFSSGSACHPHGVGVHVSPELCTGRTDLADFAGSKWPVCASLWPEAEAKEQRPKVKDDELLSFAIAVGSRFVDETRSESLTVIADHFEEVFDLFLVVQQADSAP